MPLHDGPPHPPTPASRPRYTRPTADDSNAANRPVIGVPRLPVPRPTPAGRTRHSASPRPYGPKLGAHAPAPLRTASPRTAIRCPPRLHENAAFRDEKTETATGAESIHTQALNDVQRHAPPRPSRAARGGLRRQTSLRADPDTPVFLWQHAKAESLRQSGTMRKATATGERPHPHPQNRKLSGNVRPGASQGGRHPR